MNRKNIILDMGSISRKNLISPYNRFRLNESEFEKNLYYVFHRVKGILRRIHKFVISSQIRDTSKLKNPSILAHLPLRR